VETFPVLSRTPGHNFMEVQSTDAVQVANKASGLPLLNKLFTFDPKTFTVQLNLVTQTDKESVMTFYKANCDVPFKWTNDQDGEEYEVIFARPPKCALDRLKTRWRIDLVFIQYSPL